MILKEIDLRTILSDYGPERTQKVLSCFLCKKNSEVEDFIQHKAIDHELRRLAKTILVFDEENGIRIVGFYSVSIKSIILNEKLNSTKKKKHFGSSQTAGNVIPAILIGQLGKNDAVKTDFKGSDLMDLVFNYIYEADKYLPSMVSYVEHNGSDSLVKFYEKQGFTYFERRFEEHTKGLYCHMIKTKDIVSMIENSRGTK